MKRSGGEPTPSLKAGLGSCRLCVVKREAPEGWVSPKNSKTHESGQDEGKEEGLIWEGVKRG